MDAARLDTSSYSHDSVSLASSSLSNSSLDEDEFMQAGRHCTALLDVDGSGLLRRRRRINERVLDHDLKWL